MPLTAGSIDAISKLPDVTKQAQDPVEN